MALKSTVESELQESLQEGRSTIARKETKLFSQLILCEGRKGNVSDVLSIWCR